jgi:cytochrome c556
MGAARSGDPKVIGAQAAALGDACVACHDSFRQKKRRIVGGVKTGW